MASSVINSDDGVISGTSGLKSSGGDDGVLVFQSNGTEVAKFKTTELVINDGGANYDFRVEGDTNANMLFVDASADRVGIGTNSLNTVCGILGNGADGLDLLPNVANTAQSTRLFLSTATAGQACALLNNGGDLVFTNSATAGSASGTERMRITSGGKVLIGTTTVNQSAPLEILKTGNTPTIFLAQSDTGGYNIQSRAIDNGGTFFHATFNEGASGGGTQRGSITSNGSATAYNTGSDYRLKENIAPMVGALNVIAQLKPSTFTWKSTGKQSQGFVAHELAEVVPDCVTGEKDATEIRQVEVSPAIPATFDDDGNELTPAVEAVYEEREVPVYQGIDTSFLVATLTAAIQELSAKNDALEARIAALEQA